MAATDASDPYKVYEVAEGIYWVGFADWSAGFSNNPYLIVTDEGAILIDPGSVLHYHVVAKKVLSVVKAERIQTIIVQHQDPDLCASIPKFEVLIDHPIEVVVPQRAALFMPYYGVTSKLVSPRDGAKMRIAGRELVFHATPYVHFAGAIMTWDTATRTLFASDVFAAFTRKWSLFAGEGYAEATRDFIEPYIGSQRAWREAVRKVRGLEPLRICPQHGSIIAENIDEYLAAVSKFKVGRMLEK
ncbi:MAG: MBL fold metallo-hydrolase [Planctomycetota bacterium]